jgi:multisubunit Na+/H+ antiporter MnhB subunit
MPLLASIALVAVWLIPAIAVPAGVDVVAFVVLAASVLLLIRAAPAGAYRRRIRAHGQRGRVTVVATAIGAVAIIAALAVGPTLQASVPAAGSAPPR